MTRRRRRNRIETLGRSAWAQRYGRGLNLLPNRWWAVGGAGGFTTQEEVEKALSEIPAAVEAAKAEQREREAKWNSMPEEARAAARQLNIAHAQAEYAASRMLGMVSP